MLAAYQRDFIQFAIEHGVLQFGEFELKSGRKSPYFFNAGAFNTGRALSKLGEFYADALIASGLEYDLLFGPAYKGIPLVSALAIAMSTKHDVVAPYVFNRKEVKDHGEGGHLVGAPLAGRVVIIDDVITAGTAIREVMGLITQSSAKMVGVLVAIDRQERGKGELSAIQELENEHGISVISVIKLEHIVEYLKSLTSMPKELALIENYQREYGIQS